MGLSWQQGPLSPTTTGHFLTDQPLPERLLFAEPLRRRLRVRCDGTWIADSEDVVLLHEPGRYPVAYFPLADIAAGALLPSTRTSTHHDLGVTRWYRVTGAGPHADRDAGRVIDRAAWQHTELPTHAEVLRDRVAFAWRAMDAFYEEDERILGHAADNYHRLDIRATSRHLVVRSGARVIADTTAPPVLYESGFAPRWYVPRTAIDATALTESRTTTFCPYKGVARYYTIDGDTDATRDAAWFYRDALDEAARIDDLVSFEPGKVDVFLDGRQLHLAPGQRVVPHGADRDLSTDPTPTR